MEAIDIRQLRVFIAYSREDNEHRIRLEKHLSPLKRSAEISTWYDGEIELGKDWETEIRTALNLSDIILLLISPDFIHSDYCYEVEMKRALERHEAGEATVVPILIRHCAWEDTPFARLQLLPRNGQPLYSGNWSTVDEAFSQVSKEIKSLIQNVFKVRTDSINQYNETVANLKNEIAKLKQSESDLILEISLLKGTSEMTKKDLKEIEAQYQEIKETIDTINDFETIMEELDSLVDELFGMMNEKHKEDKLEFDNSFRFSTGTDKWPKSFRIFKTFNAEKDARDRYEIIMERLKKLKLTP